MRNLIIAALISFIPTISAAHSMSPGFEVEKTYSKVISKNYELKNEYEHPAVFTVEVLTKDGKPATGWKSDKTTYKINQGGSKTIKLKFKVSGTRKLLVCSTLIEIGKSNEKAHSISRICSRLIINSLR